MFIKIIRFGVYHWSQFEFNDGSNKDKYFIALNCRITDEEISIVLPTSKVDKYEKNSKFLLDTIKIEAKESKYFRVDTIIDLKNYHIINSNKIENAIKNSKINYLGILEEELQHKIISAIKNAYTLSQIDINKLLCK